MEQYPVVIVGAGPAGLTLALSLALQEIHSIILEKGVGVNEDPRGVFLAGDAVRIFYQVGVGEEMERIGHRKSILKVRNRSNEFNLVLRSRNCQLPQKHFQEPAVPQRRSNA
jgi:2-polyprenyl-6-methoxyphenol hydroxylase-like FAD-dependent oxidoreductase